MPAIHNSYAADKDDADGYPQTMRDQRLEELGSILPGDGITFKPNIANRGGAQISQAMWKAAVDALHGAPVNSIDNVSGIIKTDWYDTPKNQSIQVYIEIKPGMVDTQNITVKVLERKKGKDGQWEQAIENRAIAAQMEINILQQARDIELNNNK